MREEEGLIWLSLPRHREKQWRQSSLMHLFRHGSSLHPGGRCHQPMGASQALRQFLDPFSDGCTDAARPRATRVPMPFFLSFSLDFPVWAAPLFLFRFIFTPFGRMGFGSHALPHLYKQAFDQSIIHSHQPPPAQLPLCRALSCIPVLLSHPFWGKEPLLSLVTISRTSKGRSRRRSIPRRENHMYKEAVAAGCMGNIHPASRGPARSGVK